MTDDPLIACKEAALRLLKFRGRSRAELTDRLASKGFDAATVRAAIDDLERAGLCGDRPFAAEVTAAELRRKPAAQDFLVSKLIDRGVRERMAARVVRRQTAGQSDLERAIALAQSRAQATTGKDQATKRRRLLGVLARRGFDEETCREAVARVMGRPLEEDA